MAVQKAKERELQTAMHQLDRLEKERQGALEQYEVSRLPHVGAGAELVPGTAAVLLEEDIVYLSKQKQEIPCLTILAHNIPTLTPSRDKTKQKAK